MTRKRLALNGIDADVTNYNNKDGAIYFTVTAGVFEQLEAVGKKSLQVYYIDTDICRFVPKYHAVNVNNGERFILIIKTEDGMNRNVEVMYNAIEDLMYV